MQIQIKLVGAFQQQRFKETVCTYPKGTSVDDVVQSLRLSRDILGTVLINGRHAHLSSILQDGDHLSILPLVDGG